MSRLAVVALALASTAACSKSAANQEPATGAEGTSKGMQPMTAGGGPAPAKTGSGGVDERLRLHADEGTIAVTAPADAKAGAESVATILVTPNTGYHVNTEFPIKLKLDAPAGVTLAKTEWTAGGSSKDKGDADALDEQHLALSIKLTPGATGTYTINGTFKFAVCDHDSCLAKKEPIAITVAAK
jgi:hypothetical protein